MAKQLVRELVIEKVLEMEIDRIQKSLTNNIFWWIECIEFISTRLNKLKKIWEEHWELFWEHVKQSQ